MGRLSSLGGVQKVGEVGIFPVKGLGEPFFQPGRKKILKFWVILGTLGIRRLQNAQKSRKTAYGVVT
jgi:hypothetical protein